MALFRETADVSVRPATPGDEAAITRTQLRAWRTSHEAVLGPALEHLDVAAVQEQWAAAVITPPSPEHRVLVACDGPRVVGFAASAPAAGDGVEVLALEVDPDHQRAGHGSRLLAACVDLARERGATHLHAWVLDGDEAREQFLRSCGLGPDGARRELASGPGADGAPRTVAEERWGAEI